MYFVDNKKGKKKDDVEDVNKNHTKESKKEEWSEVGIVMEESPPKQQPKVILRRAVVARSIQDPIPEHIIVEAKEYEKLIKLSAPDSDSSDHYSDHYSDEEYELDSPILKGNRTKAQDDCGAANQFVDTSYGDYNENVIDSFRQSDHEDTHHQSNLHVAVADNNNEYAFAEENEYEDDFLPMESTDCNDLRGSLDFFSSKTSTVQLELSRSNFLESRLQHDIVIPDSFTLSTVKESQTSLASPKHVSLNNTLASRKDSKIIKTKKKPKVITIKDSCNNIITSLDSASPQYFAKFFVHDDIKKISNEDNEHFYSNELQEVMDKLHDTSKSSFSGSLSPLKRDNSNIKGMELLSGRPFSSQCHRPGTSGSASRPDSTESVRSMQLISGRPPSQSRLPANAGGVGSERRRPSILPANLILRADSETSDKPKITSFKPRKASITETVDFRLPVQSVTKISKTFEGPPSMLEVRLMKFKGEVNVNHEEKIENLGFEQFAKYLKNKKKN